MGWEIEHATAGVEGRFQGAVMATTRSSGRFAGYIVGNIRREWDRPLEELYTRLEHTYNEFTRGVE